MKNDEYVNFEEMCEAITSVPNWPVFEPINPKEAYEHYAGRLDKETEKLTAEEKQLALLDWILDKGKTDE